MTYTFVKSVMLQTEALQENLQSAENAKVSDLDLKRRKRNQAKVNHFRITKSNACVSRLPMQEWQIRLMQIIKYFFNILSLYENILRINAR